MAVHITEIYPNPESGFEWVEIYNDGLELIHASQIKLYDPTSKSLKLTVAEIPSNSYAVATASAILNNGGDSVFLEKDGTILESITFGAIEQGKSYARCTTTWLENVLPTYARANLCEEPTDIPVSPEITDEAVEAPLEETQVSETTITTNSTIKITPSPTRVTSGSGSFILFSDKHAIAAVDKKITSGTRVSPSSFPLITPSAPSQQPKIPVPLLLIGLFSFIQVLFLVYLIFKRIRYR